jgi:endonuclease YncB( thermonuclease family)
VPVRLRSLHCLEVNTSDGEQVRREMVRLVDGVTVSCFLNGERTHDRQLGWCSLNGEEFAALLIRGGLCARCEAYDVEQRYGWVQEAAGPCPGASWATAT